MSTLIFVTRSGSKYTIDNQGIINKNGKPLDQKGSPLIYIGLANFFEFLFHDNHILPNFFEYVSPEEIKEYLDTCPGKERALASLEDGFVQSYMVTMVGLNKQLLEQLKKDFKVVADTTDIKIFMKELEEKIIADCPEGKVGMIPFSYATTVITHYLQE